MFTSVWPCLRKGHYMESTIVSRLEDGLIAKSNELDAYAPNGVGVLIQDSMNQRLLESAVLQLDIEFRLLDEANLDADELSELEIIVADSGPAERLRELLRNRETKGEGVNPTVISINAGGEGAEQPLILSTPPHDGVLALPQSPAQVAAQLSLILYSHRAFARRYQNAMEELHLNRRIFRSVTSGISVANASLPDFPLTYVNPAFEVMTGYSLEEVQGRNCRFLQGKDHDQPGLDIIRQAIRDKREALAVIKNYRKDGSPFWNELSLSPIRNRDGEVTHFVGIQTDVTARMEFEAALRESEKLAAVGRLASTIAHEINNPLESVMNLIYIALQTDCSNETKHYLETADNELQRVKVITTQSLRFFKQSTKPQAVLCSELLASMLELYRSRLTNASVTMELRERSTQPIICMESEIRQVLNNLVSNAIDAMKTSGGRLLVRTREATEWRNGSKGVMITIADDGTGIDPDLVRNIYKAFFTTKGIGGTGLGLWISSEIVDRHKGRMVVRSSQRPGRSGTVFELFLPFETDEPIKPASVQSTAMSSKL